MGRPDQSTTRKMVGCFCVFQARRGRNWTEARNANDAATLAVAAVYDCRIKQVVGGRRSLLEKAYATARRFCLTSALDDLPPFRPEPRFTLSD